MKRCAPIFLLVMLAVSCRSSGQGNGVSVLRGIFYGYEGGKMDSTVVRCSVFFKGNQTIQEVPQLRWGEGFDGLRFRILHYSYMNPDLKVCYTYSSLSDTAGITGRFFSLDLLEGAQGNNFYQPRRIQFDRIDRMPDTVLRGVNCRRYALEKSFSDGSMTFVLYARPSLSDHPVRLHKQLGDSLGCVFVRDESFFKGKLLMVTDIEYLSATLLKEQAILFERWSEKARQDLKCRAN